MRMCLRMCYFFCNFVARKELNQTIYEQKVC